MTEKLFYKDAHVREFDARILSCEPEGALWALVPDATAFFPGGGGQLADSGTLGGVRVEALREEGETIVHLCAAPLPVGESVRGALDWAPRFARMQLHSGEHLVCGVAHALWGCENVGFHMAEDCVTMDLDRELSPAQLAQLEERANELIWENVPYRCWFPNVLELAHLDYRSKGELHGAVRLVEIEGVDICACCAPHVARSGEIGLIRIADAMRHRGGMRLSLRAGRSAWEAVRAEGEEASALSALLSAPRGALVPAVQRLEGELATARASLEREALGRMERAAQALAPTEGNVCFFDADADAQALRAFVNAGKERCRVCAAFGGTEGAWKYVIGSKSVDLAARARELNAALDGRGGGSRTMLQGSCRAGRGAIEPYILNEI